MYKRWCGQHAILGCIFKVAFLDSIDFAVLDASQATKNGPFIWKSFLLGRIKSFVGVFCLYKKNYFIYLTHLGKSVVTGLTSFSQAVIFDIDSLRS